MVRRRSFSLALLVWLAGTAAYAQTLDQNFDPGTNPMTVSAVNGTTPGVERAQTFTAGLSGQLTRVEVYVSQNAASVPDGNLIMDIRATDAAGLPDGGVTPTGVLATATVAAGTIPVEPAKAWATFNFATPATIVAGQKYAIVLRASNNSIFGWWGSAVPPDPYPAGGIYQRTLPMFPNWTAVFAGMADLSLKTYVGGTVAAGVTVTQSGGTTTVTEGGATDAYTVVLNSAPTANVTITFNAGTQVSVAPAPLTFTPTNWNTAQTVTVTAVDDATVEGAHTGTITHTATSTDTTYNGITIPSVVANITDNDSGPLPPLPPPPPPATGGEGTYSGSSFLGGRMAQYRDPVLAGPTVDGAHYHVRNIAGRKAERGMEQVDLDYGWGMSGWVLIFAAGSGIALFIRRIAFA